MPVKKKGVSPVVATVLLISIVIVLALIVFMWVRSFAQESITKFGSENIELACDKVALSTSYSEGNLFVSNDGNVAVYDLNVEIKDANGHETKKISELTTTWPTNGLGPGKVFSGELSLDEPKSVLVYPILLGEGEEGETLFDCDNDFEVTL